jgi:hypothetical protein
MSKTVREWLLRVADVVEQWPTMSKDDVAVAISVSTPSGAVKYIVSTIPAEDREAVRAALPVLNTEDFSVAAERVRQAAASLGNEDDRA